MLLEFPNKTWKLVDSVERIASADLEAWNELDQVVIDASALAPTSASLHRVPRGTVCVDLENVTTFTVNYLGYAYLNYDSYFTLLFNKVR